MHRPFFCPDQPEELEQFLATTDFRFHVVADTDNTLAKRFDVHSAPTHFLIDQEGNIDAVINGAVTSKEDLGRRIRQLLDR